MNKKGQAVVGLVTAVLGAVAIFLVLSFGFGFLSAILTNKVLLTFFIALILLVLTVRIIK